MREDDTFIPNDDRLFRRIPPNQLFAESDGSRRPSSANFKDAEMSVNIESLMVEQGRPPEDTLTGYPGCFLTSVTAGQVRKHGQIVVKDNEPPVDDEPPKDPAHGLILGKKNGSFTRDMLASHVWIVAPPKA